ncbi:MAG TPA: MazG nucleotide pyrophosphohydrolase domain-containing protein [Candidatus Sulfotelmatobacter sp.]|nr:MazG nucleotide pyrophosphohydrolase domain-containing protein [Candidatus Sulfotelmatobacter sp.]
MTEGYSDFTLEDYQKLIKGLVKERGFDKETVPEVSGLFVEETGELAKSIRKSIGQKYGAHSKNRLVEEEIADVFWLLIDLSNRLGVNLAEAFEAKEKLNKSRKWQ